MAHTDKMRQATPMAHAPSAGYTSPRAMRLIGDVTVAIHPLINRIQTTIEARVLKMGGIFLFLLVVVFTIIAPGVKW
ncbi:hypothetical protein ACFLWY_02770 [Chloroflexota bacterium]